MWQIFKKQYFLNNMIFNVHCYIVKFYILYYKYFIINSTLTSNVKLLIITNICNAMIQCFFSANISTNAFSIIYGLLKLSRKKIRDQN